MQGLGDGIYGWRKQAELRVPAWIIVEAARQFSDGAVLCITGKRLIHGIAAAEVQKISGRENPAPANGYDPLEDLAINGFCVLTYLLLSEKICTFSDKNKLDL